MAFRPQNKLQGAFVLDCRNLSERDLLTKWVFRSTPYGFRRSSEEFSAWRQALAECLDVEPTSIFVVGSTAAGLSLSPTKRLRPHNPTSDVDVAIVSEQAFRTAWDWFVTQRIERIGLPAPVRDWVDAHKESYIFFRQIASDQYMEYLPFGRQWLLCLEAASRQSPCTGRSVKARIYQDQDALMHYIASGIHNLRAQLGI